MGIVQFLYSKGVAGGPAMFLQAGVTLGTVVQRKVWIRWY